REPAANSREWTIEPTTPVARPPTGPHEPIERTPSGPIAERVPTGASSAVADAIPGVISTASSASHTQLTAPSSLVQWSLWLLLPMLGAGIAIAAMLLFGPGWDRRAEPAEQPDPSPVEQPIQPPASLAATEYQPVAQRPTPPGQVRWYFSTTPRGARVSIDGELQGDPTPTWVYLPVGEEPLDIRIELDGYQPR